MPVHFSKMFRTAGGILMIAGVCFAQSADLPAVPPSVLAADKATLQTALTGDGLTNDLEILRLSRGDHPDPAQNRQTWRLEFRFIPGGTQDEAGAKFQQFLAAHPALPEHWFYRVVHLLDADRRSVSLHFYVVENEYAVYFDTASSQLVIQRGANRSIRTSLSLSAPSLGTPDRSATINRIGLKEQDISAAIRKYFDQYFGAMKVSGAKAETAWKDLTDPDYLRLTVTGMKHQVIPSHNYWERLNLSIELKQETAGWKLACYADAWYAAGLGSSRPGEGSYHLIDGKDFGMDLETYSEHLLAGLQRYLQQDR